MCRSRAGSRWHRTATGSTTSTVPPAEPRRPGPILPCPAGWWGRFRCSDNGPRTSAMRCCPCCLSRRPRGECSRMPEQGRRQQVNGVVGGRHRCDHRRHHHRSAGQVLRAGGPGQHSALADGCLRDRRRAHRLLHRRSVGC
jgi:hypothetical protein